MARYAIVNAERQVAEFVLDWTPHLFVSDDDLMVATHHKRAVPAVADYCLLCAVIHMAGTVMPGVAPAEPIAVVLQKSPHWADLADISAAAPHGIFQARAPPRA